jgi:hypothetical protein
MTAFCIVFYESYLSTEEAVKINSLADKSTAQVTCANLNFCLNQHERETVLSHFCLLKKVVIEALSTFKVKKGAEQFAKK